MTTTGLESVGGVDGLLAIPGIDQTPAAADRRVVAFEDQYLYGLGPRTGQLVAELVDAFHPADPDVRDRTETPAMRRHALITLAVVGADSPSPHCGGDVDDASATPRDPGATTTGDPASATRPATTSPA